jgi:aminobenzoyl-glutamate utilization protein B
MPGTVAGRAGLTPQKQSALAWVDANLARLSADHLTIWNFHEPAWREYRSARWYVERLRAAGFEVEAGSGDMPTAFVPHGRMAPVRPSAAMPSTTRFPAARRRRCPTASRGRAPASMPPATPIRTPRSASAR